MVRFIESYVVHTKGRHARAPFILAEWQKEEIIRPLYGTVAHDDQYDEWVRQYRIAWLEMARKNGKSEILSALALYHLIADHEESAEVYSVAADRDQASLVYNTAKRMVELSPQLAKRIEIIDSKKRLVYAKTNSFYQVLPGDAAGALGTNPSAVLFDEVLTQRDRHLWDSLRQGFGTRKEPLLIAATTAAYTTAQFALAEHEYGEMLMKTPSKDPARFVFMRNVARDWDWTDEGEPPSDKNPKGTGWYYANPALGDFLNINNLRAEAKEAAEKPSAQNSFRVFRLNQWVSQAERWLDMAVWDANGTDTFSRADLHGRECVAGLDLASTQDFTAWCLVFPGSPHDPESDGFTVVPHFFVPRHAIEARTNIRDRMEEWERSGFLTVTEGRVTDYDAIADWVTRDAEEFRIRLLGYDPWNATHLISQLEDRGQQTVKVPQTAPRLNDPCKALESALSERRLWHSGNPVLRWMADNVELEITGDGLMKPSKRKSGEKIDGIAALITALFCAQVPIESVPEVTFIPFDDVDEVDRDGHPADSLDAFLEEWQSDGVKWTDEDDEEFRRFRDAEAFYANRFRRGP
ncbi:terminase large subunit [Micromonospora sp. PSH03]|uniref:terminase large subunit n=1 Tax=Micromonospora salmantinae TaxID=2911211 RepID=UPI001EE88712|nr:terminase TerL endonuclease subunit [Micromonospora salmantinae]MCG5459629.1 terminase large subunit [Micromonospora salmantinae]